MLRRLVRPLFFALAVALPLGAQQTPAGARPAGRRASSLLAGGDSLHAELRPLEALEAYQAVLVLDSLSYGARWRVAREAVNLGMLTRDGEAREIWYATAVEYARAAVRVEPERVEGAEWLAIALGRTSLEAGPRRRVRLAEEIRSAASRALDLDSTSAAAHHVLGQWHAEIRRLGGLTRFVARRLLGGATFDEASWDEAEAHLRRAAELAPDQIIHRLELARVLLDRGRPAEARAGLEALLELPSVEPTDELHKAEARRLLEKIGAAVRPLFVEAQRPSRSRAP